VCHYVVRTKVAPNELHYLFAERGSLSVLAWLAGAAGVDFYSEQTGG
jgi:hypothetical protein